MQVRRLSHQVDDQPRHTRTLDPRTSHMFEASRADYVEGCVHARRLDDTSFPVRRDYAGPVP